MTRGEKEKGGDRIIFLWKLGHFAEACFRISIPRTALQYLRITSHMVGGF